MDKRVNDCLLGKHGDYMLPFLWLHGEPKERVREEILAIKNSGINEFCAESRPYEKFCQDEWWDDFGFILKTAKELGMRVWLLDDKKFPTGYANGYLEAPERAHLRKKLIREYQIEVSGPMRCAKAFVGGRLEEGEKIINVVAFRHTGNGETLDYKSAIDLTPTLKNGMVYWDIPDGIWRVCVTIETAPYEFKNDRLFYYIDMLNKDSCHAMIDAIYQPHYEHFKEYFGNTFVGFFSDEPAFLNVSGTYYNTLGKMYSPYPWRHDLPELIAKSAGIEPNEARLYMPALWEDLGEITSLMRMHYMEVITKLYSENFSYLLGEWCRGHGVMYIGHVIEDMGAHHRMGYGAGHYFRALDGQDMAGIDIVLTQDIPGAYEGIHRSPLADGGEADPAFFRYTLPKLASSHANMQPLKKGRAMCEIFGAFGWAEGLPFMKGLADIMLASGINYFVPHAFSPTEEDTDCPPHFYNGGKNIQYPEFKDLISYMSRICHIISEGKHKADVAVFYNAEGEWTGGEYKLYFDICKRLTQNQIEFDIIPYDYLKNATTKDGKLVVNGIEYGALIVSQSEIMPLSRLECFAGLCQNGIDVIFVDSLPKKSAEGKGINEMHPCFKAISLDTLVITLQNKGVNNISAQGKGTKYLRYYHVERDNSDIYLFSNEDINGDLDAHVFLKQEGECLIYDPWDNKAYKSSAKNGKLHLCLEGGNMLVVIFGTEIPDGTPLFKVEKERVALPLLFEIAVMEEGSDSYKIIANNSPCFDISAPLAMPNFSGCVRYRTSFEYKDGYDVIDLGQVGEIAEAYLNGKRLGLRISAPYKFSMRDAMQDGKNELEIIVKSNLAHKRTDWFSSFIQIPPTGIIGDIYLCKYE